MSSPPPLVLLSTAYLKQACERRRWKLIAFSQFYFRTFFIWLLANPTVYTLATYSPWRECSLSMRYFFCWITFLPRVFARVVVNWVLFMVFVGNVSPRVHGDGYFDVRKKNTLWMSTNPFCVASRSGDIAKRCSCVCTLWHPARHRGSFPLQ